MAPSFTHLLQQMSQRRILVIGDAIVDEYVNGESSRVSAEAPVPVLQYTGRRSVLGGAGNTAANVASLGGRVTLIGLVGDDPGGAEFTRGCAAAGIDFVPLGDGRPTTRKVRVISQQQQLLRIDYEHTTDVDAACQQRLLRAFADRLEASDLVVVSDYAKGLLTSDACREIIKIAHDANREVIVDPRPKHAASYWSCDYLTPNWRESLALLGEGDTEMSEANIRRIGTLVSRRFNANVLLTLGPRGIAFVQRDGGSTFVVPAAAQEVFDVSGAGDTVVASFALARAAGCSEMEAVSLANRAAAIVVGKRGTATVTRDELLQNGSSEARLLLRSDLTGFGHRLRHSGRRLVTVSGAFDGLRPEDLELFAQAREHGDVLVVAVSGSTRGLPRESGDGGAAAAPTQMLLGLRLVDYVCVLEDGTLVDFLHALLPDVHVVSAGDRSTDENAGMITSLGVRIQVAGPPQAPAARKRPLLQ